MAGLWLGLVREHSTVPRRSSLAIAWVIVVFALPIPGVDGRNSAKKEVLTVSKHDDGKNVYLILLNSAQATIC